MAEYTENYQLIKPGAEDFYDVADFNGNADIIDRQLKLASENGETAVALARELSVLSELVGVMAQCLKPKLLVLAPAGTVVSLTRGDTTVSGTADANHQADLVLPEIGEWQMSYVYGGTGYERTVNIDRYGSHILTAAPSLESSPWGYIDRVSREGLAQDTFSIGAEKTITISGVKYTVILIGMEHDDLAAPSGGRTKAGMTFQLKSCLPTKYQWHSDTEYEGGWADCEIRTGLLGSMVSKLGDGLAGVLKTVRKKTPAPGNSSSKLPQVTDDKLFLPSEIEVWGYIYNSSSYRQADEWYEYYRETASTTKYLDGTMVKWWLRSPRWSSSAGYLCIVYENYVSGYIAKGSESNYVSFCFCV